MEMCSQLMAVPVFDITDPSGGGGKLQRSELLCTAIKYLFNIKFSFLPCQFLNCFLYCLSKFGPFNFLPRGT